ncbi:hypothetical protein ACWDLG_26135 [Nonomuraea sp. NPDC003727]
MPQERDQGVGGAPRDGAAVRAGRRVGRQAGWRVGRRVAAGLRVVAMIAATAGTAAYALSWTAASFAGPGAGPPWTAMSFVGPATALLVLFAAFALLAAVLPGSLLPGGATAATVTRALPFVAFAGYLGGYQSGGGSAVTMAMVYALMCAWTAVTAARTWPRSRPAAVVAAAAVVCFAVLAVTRLWTDLASPAGPAAPIHAMTDEVTPAAWLAATLWGWWAARRTG